MKVSDLKEGDKIKFGSYAVANESPTNIEWEVAAIGMFTKNRVQTVTFMATKILDIRAYDAAETSASSPTERKNGNSLYEISNIDQWLNSSAPAGQWYTPQHEYDAPPDDKQYLNNKNTAYVNHSGFLYNFTQQELNAIVPSSIYTLYTTANAVVKTFDRKIFLPSYSELGYKVSGWAIQDCRGQFFQAASLETRKRTLSANAFNFSNYQDGPQTINDGWYYATRTPNGSSKTWIQCINPEGSGAAGSADEGSTGIVPCVSLNVDAEVSDTKDKDGCYVVYGMASSPFIHTHSWSSTWTYNSLYHWHECLASDCDITSNAQKDGYGIHVASDWQVITSPTTTSSGLRRKVCTVCGYVMEEEIIPAESGHEHNWSTEWSYNSGYHWHECLASNCNITDNSQKNGYGAHQESDWIIVKEATTTETGLEHKVCTICGYETNIRTIPKIESGEENPSDKGISLSSLPSGSKIKFGKYQVESETPEIITWIKGDNNHYKSGYCPLITEYIIDLRAFDAAETNNPNSERQDYGNNNYLVSNVHQWLNSSAPAGQWYTPQHEYDTPPTDELTLNLDTGYEDRPGFLYNFTEDEKKSIETISLKIASPYLDDPMGYNVSNTKVFLLSQYEVTEDNANLQGQVIEDGTKWSIFINDTSRIATFSAQCLNNSKNNGFSPWQNIWKLRTPFSNSGQAFRVVTEEGKTGNSYANTGSGGIRPALNISNNIKVSDTPDSDGYYIVYPNEFIDVTAWSDSWSYNSTHHWHDCLSGDCLDITDNSQKEGYGEHQSSNWQIVTEATETSTGLRRKVCTICGYIIAEETIPVIVPENKGTIMSVEMTSALKVDRKPTKIMMSNWVNYYEKYITAIYVCNNGFDFSPVWENATEQILHKRMFLFTNTIRLAEDWGIKVKITLSKELAQDKLPLNGFAFYWN